MNTGSRPSTGDGLTIRSEARETAPSHHGFVDRHQNRCERFDIGPGDVSVSYDAVVPDARETPPHELPDDLLHYVLPSRFCLLDELGHLAWARFGDGAPGWDRIEAMVDHVRDGPPERAL